MHGLDGSRESGRAGSTECRSPGDRCFAQPAGYAGAEGERVGFEGAALTLPRSQGLSKLGAELSRNLLSTEDLMLMRACYLDLPI